MQPPANPAPNCSASGWPAHRTARSAAPAVAARPTRRPHRAVARRPLPARPPARAPARGLPARCRHPAAPTRHPAVDRTAPPESRRRTPSRPPPPASVCERACLYPPLRRQLSDGESVPRAAAGVRRPTYLAYYFAYFAAITGAPPMIPAASSSCMSREPRPRSSLSTSTVCSPSSGARFSGTSLADIRGAQPSSRIGP